MLQTSAMSGASYCRWMTGHQVPMTAMVVSFTEIHL
jgi:hypothetical protein